MANHGVYVTEQATSVSTPNVAPSGIPFVIGIAPIQSAISPATPGRPALFMSWDEAEKAMGYSDEVDAKKLHKYNLSGFMYSHFKLYGIQPVIFCNLLDPATMKSAVAGAALSVINHKVTLPMEAINDDTIIVKADESGTAYEIDIDYAVYYSGTNCIVEAIKGGACYDATSLYIAYNKVTPESVDANAVAAGLEAIELCMTTLGVVPDHIVAPGFSGEPQVGAVMAVKAKGINGMFPAKALIDMPTAAVGGANEYSKVVPFKNANSLTDKNEIVLWPLVKIGGRVFHYSTHFSGVLASTDNENGCPYMSPSNKALVCDGLVVEDGTEILLTHAQANNLNANGIVTALNFMGGWKVWGNYTACYPTNNDPKDSFICIARMFDWVSTTLIQTFWGLVDMPMNRRLIDSILDTCNIWLNGLTGSGYVLGARTEMLDSENPLTNLMAGIIKLHIFMTPPSPAQEIDFVLEYDASYVEAALK